MIENRENEYLNKKMRFNFILFLISVLSILPSCSQHKANKDKQADKASDISVLDEDFDLFLENFSSKPTFQRQRVIFPIKATLLHPSEFGMEEVDEELTRQDWILLNFTYDSTYTTRQMDSYKQSIRKYSDSTIIEQRGIDNGIFADYYFVKKDGKWFLKSFTDITY